MWKTKHIVPWRITTTISTFATLGLLTAPATAQEDYENDDVFELRAGTGYSDNIASAPAALADSANYLLLGVSAALETERRRLRASLNGDLDYGFYSSDLVEDSPMGRLVAGLTLIAIPSVFEWVTTNDFGSVEVDLLRAPSPVNRQYLNVFETGPDVMIPLGTKTSLDLGGRYEQRQWEESNRLDGEALSKSVGVVRTMSPGRSAGVTATTQRVEYDNPGAEPYDVTSVYASYAATLSRGSIDFDVGRSELELANDTTDGPYVEITWNRTLSARSNLYIRGSQKFEDATDQFFGDNPALFIDSGNTALISDPRTATEVGVGYQLGSRRNNVGFDVSVFEDEQVTQAQFDREGGWLAVHVSHQLGQAWDVGARLAAGQETRTTLGGTSDQRDVRLMVSRKFGLPLTFSIEYGRRTWSADFGASTAENAVLLALAWSPI